MAGYRESGRGLLGPLGALGRKHLGHEAAVGFCPPGGIGGAENQEGAAPKEQEIAFQAQEGGWADGWRWGLGRAAGRSAVKWRIDGRLAGGWVGAGWGLGREVSVELGEDAWVVM